MQTQPMGPPVAFITGAARRIGAAIARALHADGFNVVLHYHTSAEAAEDLCSRLNAERDDSAVTVCADLSDCQMLPQLISQTLETFGQLNVLVNNAARFYRTPIGEVDETAWDDLLQTNLKAPFFLAQAAAPHLSATKGCIINIGDVHGLRPMRDYAVYCISKAGLTMLTQALAKELGPEIRVNAVAPSPVMLPEGENKMSKVTQEKVIARTALERIGEAVDVARAVMYFVRDGNYTAGRRLTCDKLSTSERIGEAVDVARAVMYFVRDGNYTTGRRVTCDKLSTSERIGEAVDVARAVMYFVRDGNYTAGRRLTSDKLSTSERIGEAVAVARAVMYFVRDGNYTAGRRLTSDKLSTSRGLSAGSSA